MKALSIIFGVLAVICGIYMIAFLFMPDYPEYFFVSVSGLSIFALLFAWTDRKAREKSLELTIPRDPKSFALYAIAPYFKDPSICGYENEQCKNLTADGKMCVAGRFMLPKFREKNKGGSISHYLKHNSQKSVFIPEVVGILTDMQWGDLQSIHDTIANNRERSVMVDACRELNLFTLEELESYCRATVPDGWDEL